MPYFVYRVLPLGALEPMGSFSGFREAKQFAQSLRETIAPNERTSVRVIFAENAEAAAELIVTPRPAREDGDDY